MLSDVKTVIRRNPATLLQDAVGAVALIVMLMVGLHLPSLV